MKALCRECLWQADRPPEPRRCPACGSPRLVVHDELDSLGIAHMDCDAFYASVEKRDRPELRDRPVIVGGGRRGVVTTACYIARLYGVGSAQPMFKALKACPDAVVLKPDFAKYTSESRRILGALGELTPLVQPCRWTRPGLTCRAPSGSTAAQRRCSWCGCSGASRRKSA